MFQLGSDAIPKRKHISIHSSVDFTDNANLIAWLNSAEPIWTTPIKTRQLQQALGRKTSIVGDVERNSQWICGGLKNASPGLAIESARHGPPTESVHRVGIHAWLWEVAGVVFEMLSYCECSCTWNQRGNKGLGCMCSIDLTSSSVNKDT